MNADRLTERASSRLGTANERVIATVFGDRRGVALFLGSLCALALFTRLGIFITDTYTVANAFVALTEGHLAVDTPFYGTNLDTPGMQLIDGAHYGRNYGQLVASLPAYALLQALSVVTDLRIAFVALWSLLLLAFALQLGHLLDQRPAFAVGGSVAALALFVGNIAVATPFDRSLTHVVALQLTALVAGALLAVVVYRLVAHLRTPRAGVLAGVIVVLATPIGFWAPIPKRHVFTTLLVLTAIYALLRSRAAEHPQQSRRLHGSAYAMAGLLAWIHSPEALVLFASLVAADALAIGRFDRRRVATVAGVFALSLLPFVVTNLLVSGSPFRPPRLPAEPASIGVVPLVLSAGVVPWLASVASTGQSVLAVPVLSDVASAAGFFVDLVADGVDTFVSNPDQVYHTFVRSGFVRHGPGQGTDQAINLTVLESAPILAALVALPAVAVARLRSHPRLPSADRLAGPTGAVGVSIAVFSLLLTLVYIERLPLYAQVSVRYLAPLYAIGVVGIVLATPAGRAITAHLRTFVWSFCATVLLGSQGLLVVVVRLDFALGEAFQFHALLGLAVGGALALWTLSSVATDRFDRFGAVLLGLTAGAGAIFSLFVVVAYAGDIGRYPAGGEQFLPLFRVISDLVSTV